MRTQAVSKPRKKATDLKIGTVNRMSRNASHRSRFHFFMAKYLSHTMQNETWDEPPVLYRWGAWVLYENSTQRQWWLAAC